MAVTPATTPDRDVLDVLVASSATDDDRPEVAGDSAYVDGDTRLPCRSGP